MKREMLRVAIFLGLLCLADPTPAETADSHANRPPANVFERLSRVEAGLSLAWGEHTMARQLDTQAMFIRHTATELQRRIAERNARAYVAQLAPDKRKLKKKARYIAVPTVRSKETSGEAKEVLMIWDIPRETLVGKNVYEVSTTPQVGKLANYDNLVAEYVGKPAKDF